MDVWSDQLPQERNQRFQIIKEDAKLSLITDDSYTESQKTVVYKINKQNSFVFTHPSNDLYSSKNKMCRVIFLKRIW